MQGDRQAFFIDPPEFLEDHFRLAARVHEYQGRAVAFDCLVDIAERVPGGMAGPRHPLPRLQDLNVRLDPATYRNDIGHGVR